MPTTVKTGWLNDKNGEKFAPKTLVSQVQTSDGVLLNSLLDELQTEANIQSDWSQTDSTKTDYIKNKPELGALAAKDQVVKADLSADLQAAVDRVDFANGGTMSGSLVINGDLTVNGISTTVETFNENINVEDNTITLRHNATTGLQNGDYTGIVAQKYDGTNNGMLVFDNNGTAYVGDEGDVQPLATRKLATEDNGELVSWDAANQTLVKAPVKVDNIVTKDNFDSLNTVLSTNTNNAEMSYVKDVPADSANYAAVQKIGGMTRKCTNLIPFPYDFGTSTTDRGITFDTNSDGFITVNGTAERGIFKKIAYINALNGDYFISGCPAGGSDNTYNIIVDENNLGIATDYGSGAKFSASNGNTYTVIIYIPQGSAVSNLVFKPMLNAGTTALPYEPYFEGLRSAKVTEVKSVGVNLIPYPYANNTKTTNGITFTVNGDGSITANGTATGQAYFDLVELGEEVAEIDTDMFLSGCPEGGGGITYGISMWRNLALYSDHGQGVKIPQGTVYQSIYIVVNEGVTVNKITFKPMLNKGSTALPYTPYVEHTLPIPEAVQALDGYGLGINENCYNYIDWEKKQFVKRVGCVDMGTLNWNTWSGLFYTNIIGKMKGLSNLLCEKYPNANVFDQNMSDKTITGNHTTDAYVYVKDSAYTDAATFKAAMQGVMLVYELAEPIVTDISDLITADNLIGVEGGGTLTFENEHKYAVPSEVVFYKEKAEAIAADKIVGNLIGVSTRAISDEDGNSIVNTYMKKSNALEVISTLTDEQLQKLINLINTIELD